MTQPGARSSSLQRSSRAGSEKRGQRAQTPRRLSDLPERPAWDATSSNLERFKLSAEEQERRKASRVSKNRPLASSDGKRNFVEAWAKHITASVLGEDTEPDQDSHRSSSVARDLPINYGNVVEMLRKSPPVAAAAAAARHAEASASAGADSPSCSGAETFSPSTEISAQPSALGGVSTAAGAAGSGSGARGNSTAGAAEPFGASAGSAAKAGPCSGMHGRQPSQGSDATLAGKGRGAAAADAAAASSGGAPLHRGDISITPAALRPRFNPAEATTIIAFGEDSEGGEDYAVPGNSRGSPGDGVAAAAAGRGAGRGDADPVTVAFEAALFGRGGPAMATGTGLGLGGGPTLAWATSRSAASPIDTAATDVERRLRALEAALGASRGGGGGGASSQLLHEEVTELRQELRQVQADNAKLRQELGAFSSHASTLLTQLQAQVQQLLRPSGGGAVAAGVTAPAAPFHAARPHHAAPSRPTPVAATSVPTTAAAAAAAATHSVYGGLASHGDLYGAQYAAPYQLSQPHAHQPALQQAPLLQSQTQQPVARRNIFADLDISSLRPLGAAAHSGGGGGEADSRVAVATPHTAFRPAGSGAPTTAVSPQIDVSTMPYSVPVRDMDDAEVVLPSFAAFRRSAGAATFTSARPGARSATLTSPHLVPAAPGPTEPDPARVSPSSAAAVQPRSFPTQYQPRSLGGVVVRPGGSKPPATTAIGAVAAAAAGGVNAASGAYVTSLTASAAAAAATGSDAAAAALARSHSGLPQPLVFSVGPEFRSARTTGLSAENSMSLSAHTAAAAAVRNKASVPTTGTAR